MKKLLLFAAVAGLGLVSASPPGKGPEAGPREARHAYPPCSRAVTDSCIQLYERGRRDRREAARDEPRGRPDRYAEDDHGGHRWCREHHAYHGGHHDRMTAERRPVRRIVMAARVTRVVGCRCAPAPRRQVAQRVRRAGERG
jgi:hypothetical protein